jgi:hypothetical protein
MKLAALAVPALLILTLTACGPGTPATSPSPTPEPTTASATPTPTPTPTTAPVAYTCENIVSPGTIEGFASQGISITPPADFSAKLTSEGNALAAFFTAGGVLCQTGAGAGAYEIYGIAVLTEAQFAPVRSQFLAEGYHEVIGDVGVGYELPGDTDGLPRFCYHRPGVYTICGNESDRIEEIEATLGLS